MERYIFTAALVLILVILFCVFNSEEKLPTSLDPNRSIRSEGDYGINIQTENNDFAGVITVNEIKHPMGMYDYEYTNVLVAYCTVEQVMFGEYSYDTIELKIHGREPYIEGERYFVFAEKLQASMAGQFYHTIEDGIYKINPLGYLKPYSKIGKTALEKLNTLNEMHEYLADKHPGYRDDKMYAALS